MFLQQREVGRVQRIFAQAAGRAESVDQFSGALISAVQRNMFPDWAGVVVSTSSATRLESLRSEKREAIGG